MRAEALIVTHRDERGRTRLTRLRGQVPLVLRQIAGLDPVTVCLVGGAAGPIAGDDLKLHIEVGEGTVLRIISAAAAVVLAGPAGATSQLTVTAAVAAAGRLEWLPEQVIAAAGCDHRATARVTLAEGAQLIWRDELICGRYAEEPGYAVMSMNVQYAGRPLLRQAFAVGTGAPGWDGPAVLGGARAAGTVLFVNVMSTPPAGSVQFPLAGGPACLRTAVAPDAHGLRAQLGLGLGER